MIGGHHATTQFAGEVRVGPTPAFSEGRGRVVDGLGCAECTHVLAFVGRSPEVECLVITSSGFLERALPKAIGIVAIERQQLAIRHRCGKFRPTRSRVERQVISYVQRYLLECHEVRTATTVLVVELACHDRTAIFPLQSLHLGEDLPIKALHIEEETRVFGPHADRLTSPLSFGEG